MIFQPSEQSTGWRSLCVGPDCWLAGCLPRWSQISPRSEAELWAQRRQPITDVTHTHTRHTRLCTRSLSSTATQTTPHACPETDLARLKSSKWRELAHHCSDSSPSAPLIWDERAPVRGCSAYQPTLAKMEAERESKRAQRASQWGS